MGEMSSHLHSHHNFSPRRRKTAAWQQQVQGMGAAYVANPWGKVYWLSSFYWLWTARRQFYSFLSLFFTYVRFIVSQWKELSEWTFSHVLPTYEWAWPPTMRRRNGNLGGKERRGEGRKSAIRQLCEPPKLCARTSRVNEWQQSKAWVCSNGFVKCFLGVPHADHWIGTLGSTATAAFLIQ